jgi:hypothetical protein
MYMEFSYKSMFYPFKYLLKRSTANKFANNFW